MNTHSEEILTRNPRPISFVWSVREDGAEVFYARHSDGSNVLSAEELQRAEQLILAHAA
jgi:hypothetical protein